MTGPGRPMEPSHERHFSGILKSSATFLSRWKGAKAEFRELTSSHKTLRILLTREDEAGNLMIACLDPLRIQGPVRWENSDIAVSRAFLPEDGTDGFLVSDAHAGVQILCGAIEVKENVKK
jgi:hypothetical protein